MLVKNHKSVVNDIRSTVEEHHRRELKAVEHRHEDEIDKQRQEFRSKRIKLERELQAPPPVAPVAPVAPPQMAAPVTHAAAHMHMSMHPQQGYAPPPTMQYGYNRTSNMDMQRMMAAYRPY